MQVTYLVIKCVFVVTFTETVYTFCYIRLQLAALHFNENSSREQAVTQQGELRYEVLFPKFKRGGYTVRKKTVQPTYSELLVYKCICFTCSTL